MPNSTTRRWNRDSPSSRAKARFNFLGKFHKLIQKSASHYTLDGDASERLMLKYYEYLYRIRSLLQDSCGVAVLANLEAFPVDLDPSLREYHEKIAARIEAVRSTPLGQQRSGSVLHPQDAPVLPRRPHLLRGHLLSSHQQGEQVRPHHRLH